MSAPAVIGVNGRRTRVRVEGDPVNPPILLLHGIGRSLEDWAPQYPRLAPTEIEVIAPDYINEAYERVLSTDVRYRFVIDTSSLKGA